MTQKAHGSTDPDIIASFKALKRAARKARELGLRTGTPVYVMIRGRIVDLTERELERRAAKAQSKRSGSRAPRSTAARPITR